MKPQIHPAVAEQLGEEPSGKLEVIVRARRDLDELLAQLPADVEVQHTYRLIDGAAVRCSISSLRLLAASPAVKSIEPVGDVGTW